MSLKLGYTLLEKTKFPKYGKFRRKREERNPFELFLPLNS
jgi:hypothetical protein